MTETPAQELPVCQLCGVGTEADLHDPEVGQVCPDCALRIGTAERALEHAGFIRTLTQPKNSKPKTKK